VSTGARTRRTMIYNTYAHWCEEQSRRGVAVIAESKTKFKERLEEMGHKIIYNKAGDECWKDVKLA